MWLGNIFYLNSLFFIISGNVDIVNGNLKLILGLIWSLIVRYQIGRSKFPPKKLMLAWLKVCINMSKFSTMKISVIYCCVIIMRYAVYCEDTSRKIFLRFVYSIITRAFRIWMTVFLVFTLCHPVIHYIFPTQECLVNRVCLFILKIFDEFWYSKILIKPAKLYGSISGQLSMTVTLVRDLNK